MCRLYSFSMYRVYFIHLIIFVIGGNILFTSWYSGNTKYCFFYGSVNNYIQAKAAIVSFPAFIVRECCL